MAAQVIPSRLTRRQLLRLSAGACALALVRSLNGNAQAAGSVGPARPTLVLLEMRGGNDGLNTVAPFEDPLYLRARPGLALKGGIPLGRGLVMHPALAPLDNALQSGRLHWILGVGWPDPSRSHFKAMDQWATNMASGEGDGWLAKAVLRSRRHGPLVSLGSDGSAAVQGAGVVSVQMSPDQLDRSLLQDSFDPAAAGDNPMLARLLELEQAGRAALRQLSRELAPLPEVIAMPGSPLGKQLAMALRLIGSNLSIPVIQVSQGGYDTHSGQRKRHELVLEQLAGALAGFERGLQRLGRSRDVTLLAYSEFGRRLRQNSSGGTDHGSASVALVLSNHHRSTLVGSMPSLARLDSSGDLIPTMQTSDFLASFQQLIAV